MNAFTIENIIIVIAIIFATMALYYLIKKSTNKLLNIKKINNKKQETMKNFILNIIRYVFICIDILIILEVFGVDTNAILASLGIVGLVIGLAVKDMIEDFVAGAGIVLDDTYNIGDWVTINNFKGEVIDVGMRNTRLKSYVGDVLIINNGSINSIINHSIESVTVIIDVKVSFSQDNDKIESILSKYCQKMTTQIENLKNDIKFLGIENIKDSFLEYRITAEVKNGSQFEIKRQLYKTLKDELDKNKIEIPYEHMVIYNG